MDEFGEIIDKRREALIERNKMVRIHLIAQFMLTFAIVLNIGFAFMGQATGIGVILVCMNLALLLIQWFYSLTERFQPAHMARGLAGDLISHLAYNLCEREGFISRSKIINLATNISHYRMKNATKYTVRNGRFTRLTGIPNEYPFGLNDIQQIMAGMEANPEMIDVYATILELIRLSIEDGDMEVSRKDGK